MTYERKNNYRYRLEYDGKTVGEYPFLTELFRRHIQIPVSKGTLDRYKWEEPLTVGRYTISRLKVKEVVKTYICDN